MRYFKIHQTLKPDGVFLFNIEHPIFTSGVGQDWIYTNEGKPQYWLLDNYFYSEKRKTNFLGCDVTKQHHTLTQILMGLLNSGFIYYQAKEPQNNRSYPYKCKNAPKNTRK